MLRWLLFSICLLHFSTVSARLARHPSKSRGAIHSTLGRSLNDSAFTGDDPNELRKRDGTKYVFIHHMVGNTFPYTQADWEDDIRQIQAKGVDGIALNIGSSDWQRGQVASAYAAASAVGARLKLFISFDFTEMPCNIPDVVSRTNQWANHPYQFKVNGKTMISTFSGDCFGNSGWQSIKTQTNGYLMPFIWGLEGQFNNWPSLDSWMCWGCAWPQGDYTKNLDDDNYYISQIGTRYAATISPWFYTHFSYKNYLLNSDAWLLVTRWEQLMSLRDQLTFVELVSWNDYGESHHLGPVKGAMPSGTNWVNGLPHTAWYDLCEYYIKAFQTGSYPAITKDVIYFWARSHPASATASSDSLGKPTGWDWVEDSLWVVVFATSPGSVTLKSGTNQQAFSVNAGVTKLKLGLAPGKVTVSMTKNGQVVINSTPSDFTFITNPSTYNFNPYVGSASAVISPITTSANSSTSTGASSTSTRLSSSTSASLTSASLTSTTTSRSTSTTPSSATPTASPIPSGYTYLGCYNDPGDARVLNGGMTSSSAQTIASCVASCATRGFSYAGTEYGSECWCGSAIRAGAASVSNSDCSMPCSGKSSDTCGAGHRLSLYRIGASSSSSSSPLSTTSISTSTSAASTSSSIAMSTTSTSSSIVPSPTPSYLGCYVDPSNARILNGGSTSSSSQSVNSCLSSCAARGFAFAGTEYGAECWCGSILASGAAKSAESDCSMSCSGKSSDKCGGPNRMSLYRIAGGSGTSSSTSSASTSSSATSSTPSSSVTSVRSSSTVTSVSISTSSSSAPSATPSVSWSYVGCVAEGTTGNRRALTGPTFSRSDMTPERCQSLCSGYDYAGTEYGSECFCGNSITNNGATGAVISESSCSSSCSGDASKRCGGSWTLSLYTTRRASTQSVQWTNVGCFTDASTRLLRGSSQSNSRMTNQMCTEYCSSLNFVYAATEAGTECYCGSELRREGGAGNAVSSAECNVTCSGDANQKCGASWRANLHRSSNAPPSRRRIASRGGRILF